MRKESYFTRETIAPTAAAMAAELPRHPRAAAFCPARAALLVIDMQDYFLNPASHAFLPAAPAIVPQLNALIAAFRARQRPVLFTRHENTPRDAGQMASWWRELPAPDQPLAALHAGLALEDGPVMVKTQYDAFHRTGLAARLRRAGADQLAIAGVATHLCCESTARAAFVRGFAVFVAVDGTATWNRELHLASLRALAHACAVPLLARDLLAALAEGS
jgi:nicotinamidase-related amidase